MQVAKWDVISFYRTELILKFLEVLLKFQVGFIVELFQM